MWWDCDVNVGLWSVCVCSISLLNRKICNVKLTDIFYLHSGIPNRQKHYFLHLAFHLNPSLLTPVLSKLAIGHTLFRLNWCIWLNLRRLILSVSLFIFLYFLLIITQGEQLWPSVRVFDSGLKSLGFPTSCRVRFWSFQRQFHLSQFASVYSAANEYQHCWEDTCDGLASCPGESVQFLSKLIALNETRFKDDQTELMQLHSYWKIGIILI